METVMAKWWVLETTGKQIMTILPKHIRKTHPHSWREKNMKLNHHVTSDQGIKDHDSTHISSFSVQSVIIMDPVWRLQLVRTLIQLDDQQNIVAVQASASTNLSSAQVEAAGTMVVSTVVAEMTGIWQIWASYGGTEDWRSGRIPKFCTVWNCNVSGDGGQADTPDLQAQHELLQGARPRTEGSHHSLLHGYRGQMFAVWFQSGIKHNLCADSWGQFYHSGRLRQKGHRNSYHSWWLDGHCQHQQLQVTVPSLPWGNRW